MVTRPPTAVSPEIAFVTDMRGEWSAGVTADTSGLPARHASASTVIGTVSDSPAAMPMATCPPILAVSPPPVPRSPLVLLYSLWAAERRR